ncbi:MAG: inositol monophosphatase family protein [Cyanobacteria bacterium P01_C01_bin.89]
MKSLENIAEIAISTGWGAADILHEYYRKSDLSVDNSKEGPVTAADLASNRYILEQLKGQLGTDDFGYLSEETYQEVFDKTGSGRVNKDWVWIIDPLDGTKDFIKKTGEYALHIALVYQGRPHVSVVACPEADMLYCAVLGSGTVAYSRSGGTRSPKVSEIDDLSQLKVVVSRTHRDDRFNKLIETLPTGGQKAVGSVGGKIVAIIEQKADIYLSLSGKSAPKDWDMAAPELILTEAGGKFTHFDGQPLLYNQGDPCQWGGRAASNSLCHGELCEKVTQILRKIDQ